MASVARSAACAAVLAAARSGAPSSDAAHAVAGHLVRTAFDSGHDVDAVAEQALAGVVDAAKTLAAGCEDTIASGAAGATVAALTADTARRGVVERADVVRALMRGASEGEAGGDGRRWLPPAARGALIGVMRGARAATGPDAEAIARAVGCLVRAAAERAGDVAAVAASAVEGAILGARETGVSPDEAASLAAHAAIGAAGDLSAIAVDAVERAVSGAVAGVKVAVQPPFD